MEKCANISNFTDDCQLCVRNEQLLLQTTVLISWYKSLEVPLATFGILGHLLSLLTLMLSRNMQTSSFLYHKVLTVSELFFCINAVIQSVVGHKYAVDRHLTYATYQSAFYLACISRAVSSVSGYTTLYMTLLIANDRFFAVLVASRYAKVKSRRFALLAISISFLLSTLLHSWSSVVEYTVKQVVKANSSVGYQTVLRSSPSTYLWLRDVKNVYNSIIRFSYPIVLATLTIAVIVGFWLQHRRRNHMRIPRKLSKKDLNLFSLLILIVSLAFLQVIPSELKRIFDVFYHKSTVSRIYEDSSLSYETRLNALEFSYYGLMWTKVFANLATYINRSFNFYLYFCFNGAFRTEFLNILFCNHNRSIRQSSRMSTSLRLMSSTQ